MSVAPTAAAVVGAPLTDISLSTKAMSVVSVTSQCSYSSTIVHVPQPESGTYSNKPIISVAYSLKKMITGIRNHRKLPLIFVLLLSISNRSYSSGGCPDGQ